MADTVSSSRTARVAEIGRFNALAETDARALLEACLAVPRWVQDVLAGRPYADVDEVLDRGRAAAATLSPAEVEAALGRHPRIGERAGAAHDAKFSAREQAGVSADEQVRLALRRGNAAYEARFDQVFLIRAAGRSAAEILAELDRRLQNSEAAELAEVVGQLGQIAALRLEQVLSQ